MHNGGSWGTLPPCLCLSWPRGEIDHVWSGSEGSCLQGRGSSLHQIYRRFTPPEKHYMVRYPCNKYLHLTRIKKKGVQSLTNPQFSFEEHVNETVEHNGGSEPGCSQPLKMFAWRRLHNKKEDMAGKVYPAKHVLFPATSTSLMCIILLFNGLRDHARRFTYHEGINSSINGIVNKFRGLNGRAMVELGRVLCCLCLATGFGL